jgi:hypothetical protein
VKGKGYILEYQERNMFRITSLCSIILLLGITSALLLHVSKAETSTNNTWQNITISSSIAKAMSTEDDQDSAWKENTKQLSSLLDNDFRSISSVSNSKDLVPLSVFGRYLIYDTQRAIDNNKQYKVSTKYRDAQKEWELALHDYNLAGKFIMEAGDIVQNNTDTSVCINQYTAYLNSGNQHDNKYYEQINAT